MAEVSIPRVNPSPSGDSRDCLRVLLLGRTGQGKSTTGNKLLNAGGESELRGGKIEEFVVGGGEKSCTHEVRSIVRQATEKAKAVQIVDTPGFADSTTVKTLGVYKANLAMFRDLIRNRNVDKFRIDRVLYFLPCRGPLERADAVLQDEIMVMQHFFGYAIFGSMVLVGTFEQRMQDERFDKQDFEDTKKTFKKALELAFTTGCIPECPPVIFIGLKDAGGDILHQIEGAAVTGNKGVILDRFVHGTCSKCSANYLHQDDKPSDPSNQIGAEVPTKGGEQKDDTYSPSMCHPLIVPKYSFWEKAAGHATHVATLYIPLVIQKLRRRELPWPALFSFDEMCANCQQSPGTNGCLKVGTKYEATLPTGKRVVITVDHFNNFEDIHSKHYEVS